MTLLRPLAPPRAAPALSAPLLFAFAITIALPSPQAWSQAKRNDRVPASAWPTTEVPAPPTDITPKITVPNSWATVPNTTVVPRRKPKAAPPTSTNGRMRVTFKAQLVENGDQISKGLVWHVFRKAKRKERAPILLGTYKKPTPKVSLTPGTYVVNAAFGRANLTRVIEVKADTPPVQVFTLNAGGLQVKALLAKDQPGNIARVRYDIYSDERDRFGALTKVMTGAKPGVIVRLNAGIYRIVSTYGDANAQVRSDLAVEAGKLTVAVINHNAARITFKLVNKRGGDTLAGTRWTITTPKGKLVKESFGALPTHILAAGTYVLVARNGTRTIKRQFTAGPGDVAEVEIIAN
ncbi:MAG: hypothetical protein AAFR04_12230 [Pseudomonadota bacterium]